MHLRILSTSAVVAAALLGQSAHAQTASGWTGAADTLWSNAGNWNNGIPSSGTVVDLLFGVGFVNAGGTGSVISSNDIVGYNGWRMTFEDTSLVNDPAFTITGNGFTLFDFGGQFPKIENFSNAAQTFNLSGAVTLTGGGAGKAEINPVNGDLVFSSTTPVVLNSPLDIFGANGKTLTFNGVVSGAAANPITLKQDSRLVLSAANTYAGATNIAAGVVRATTDAGALGTGALNLQGGALELANDTGLSFGRNTTVSANATITSDRLTSGAGVTHTLGTLSIGGQTLTISAGANVSSGTAGITFGVTTIAAGNSTIITNANALTTLGATALTGSLIIDGAGNTTIAGNTSGSGTLTKNGTGTLLLSVDPNHSGPTVINGGILQLTANSIDSNITINSGGTFLNTGTINDANSVTVNTGGTWDVRVSDTLSRILGDGGIVTKGTAGAITLTLNSATAAAFAGSIQDGAGTINITKNNSNALTWTGTNSYTGNTQISTGGIVVQGVAGRLSGGGIVIVGDNNGNDETLTLGNTADVIAGALDRVGDASTLRFNGTTAITYNGAAAGGATSEAAAGLDFAAGAGTLSLNPASGGEVEIVFGSLARQNGNATGVIRGTGLGLAAGSADSSRVIFTAAPATVGLGGTGPSASIVPFLIGGSSATGAPDTFLRYDSANGLVPLGAADYSATIAGSTDQNVSLAAPETLIAGETINALRVTGTGSATVNADVLIRSGAILFSGSGTIDGTGTIQLGHGVTNGTGAGQQAVLQAAGTTAVTGTINANIVASGGLIIGDAGGGANVLVLGGDNQIAGGIVVNNGILRLGSDTALNNEFFNDLVLRAGNSATNGALSTGLQLNGQNTSVVFAGNDRLQGSTRIENGLAATTSILTIVTNANSSGNDGILQNGAGILGLTKQGNAQLILEQNNSFTGPTEILQGQLRLQNNSNGRLSGTSSVTIRSGGVLYIHNQSDQIQNDRVNNAAPFHFHGGAFQYDQNQSDFGTVPSETLGAFNIHNGSNQVSTDPSHANDTQVLTLASLTVSPGAALNFQNFSTAGHDVGIGEGNSRNRVVITTVAATPGGILGGSVYHTKEFNAAATQDVVNFAAYAADVDTAAGAQPSVAAFSAYNTGGQNTWLAPTVANPAADVTLDGNKTIEALRLGGGIDLNAGGFSLNLSQGGLVHNGVDSTISNGTLTAGGAGAGELAIRVEDNLTVSTLTISGVISDNGVNPVSLLKTGADTLALTGTNTYTGRTTVGAGILGFTADENLGAVPAVATPAHLRLYGGTLAQTATTGTVTLDGNRGLELGGGISTISAAAGSVLVYNASSITSNGASGLTLVGDVDMALTGAVNMGGAFTVTGTTAAGGSVVSLAGLSNNIEGSLIVATASNSATLNYNVPGGVLTVGAGNPNGSTLDVGVRATTGVNSPNVGVMDLTGSDRLIATVDRVRVGTLIADPPADQNTRGTLLLPANAEITAGTEVLISDSNGDQLASHPSLLTFGAGVSTLTTPLLTVAQRKANGTLNIAPGGVLNYSGFGPGTGDLWIARNNTNTGTTATGVFNMTGGTLIADLDEIIIGHKSGTGGSNSGSNGTLTLGATANNVRANSLFLGDSQGDSPGTASGTVNMGGGSFLVNQNVVLGNRAGTAGVGTGVLNLTGGTFTVGGNIVTMNSANANATVTLEGGALDMTGGTISADTFNLRAGTLSNVAEVFTGDGTTPAGLTKTTAGIAALAGTNAYTGVTNITAGTLLVSGSLTGSVVNVAAGTLGGSGSILNAVTVGDGTGSADAILSPGESIGTLTTGALAFDTDGLFRLELNTTNLTTDLLASTGVVNLGLGVVSLSAFDLGGATLGNNEVFTFITATSVDGFFAGLPDGAEIVIDSNTFTVDYTPTSVELVAVPEPGSVLILLGGLASLAGFSRRRATRASV